MIRFKPLVVHQKEPPVRVRARCETLEIIGSKSGFRNQSLFSFNRFLQTLATIRIVENHSWADIKHVDDLGKKFLKELEEFFVNYHELTGKEYRILDVKGPGAARKCIKDGMTSLRGFNF